MRRDPPELKAPQRQRKNCAWPALMSAGLNDQRVSCAFFLTGLPFSKFKNYRNLLNKTLDLQKKYTIKMNFLP